MKKRTAGNIRLGYMVGLKYMYLGCSTNIGCGSGGRESIWLHIFT
jgi:hypothetical protein